MGSPYQKERPLWPMPGEPFDHLGDNELTLSTNKGYPSRAPDTRTRWTYSGPSRTMFSDYCMSLSDTYGRGVLLVLRFYVIISHNDF